MSTVLVTGGSGFVGTNCIIQLLNKEYVVRTTIRDSKKKEEILSALRKADVEPKDRLSFFEANLLSDGGWEEAMRGCDYVLHVASPFPASVPKDENDLIRPAKEGTLRVLQFARDAGVRRVVVTSSSVAINYGHSPQKEKFTEETWTNINGPYVMAYAKSKTIAEQAAWNFIKSEGNSMEMVTVNPVGIFGPANSSNFSTSVLIVKQMLEGKMPLLPKVSFGVVDVRDVADLHLRAMERPEANGQRFLAVADGYISFKELAELLKNRLGDKAKQVSTRSIPDFLVRFMALFFRDAKPVLAELGNVKDCSNEKAKRLLGWNPLSIEESIMATASSLIENGESQFYKINKT